MSGIPVRSFYGSKHHQLEAVAAQLERHTARFGRMPTCARPRPTLLGPAAAWHVFTRQADALRTAAASPGLQLMVFGCEERAPGGGGRRAYLVCHPDVFWCCDVQKRPEDRCSYEVIRQGVPCKLYLDLEFDRACNAGRDGDAMVDLFIRIIAAAVDHLFQIKCVRCDVVDLCASSNKKFSRHLIFNSKGLVFKDNIHVGNLVKDICGAVKVCLFHNRVDDLARLGLQAFSEDELNTLRVTSSSEHSLFCDESVYTKNRNFRVYKSSKFGKRRPLVKSAHNQYTPHQSSKTPRDPRDNSSDEASFLDSLVSYIEGGPEPLVHHRRSDAAASTRPLPAGPPGDCVDGGGGSCSPYPEIDRFVRGLVAPGGVRRWSYFADSERVVYDIVGYRFCQNVGRWHRSNNIIVVVNVREASFYQKCHDPACQGYRSDERALPSRLVPWRHLDGWDGVEAGAFPDCGTTDSEMTSAAALAEPAPAGRHAAAAPGAAFPDCGVQDWELQEAGEPPEPATATTAEPNTGSDRNISSVWDDLPDVWDEIPDARDDVPVVWDDLDISEVTEGLPDARDHLTEVQGAHTDIRSNVPDDQNYLPDVWDDIPDGALADCCI